MDSCIECGSYVPKGQAYYNNEAARAFIPFAGRLMSDGPFCSKGCKRNYLSAKEAQAEGKALKKEAKALGVSVGSDYDGDGLKDQRRILELRKEEREAEETRERSEKAAEETRQRQDKAAVLRGQGYVTRAFLLHHQNAVLGVVVGYLIAAFIAAIVAGERGKMAAWVGGVAGLLLIGAVVQVVRRIVRENTAVKNNI